MVSNTHDPYQLQRVPTEFWDADRLKPYDKNTKVHSREQVDTLIKSIKEFGLLDPIIVDYEGVIIAGHGRFEALVKMGKVRDIPVKQAAHLTKNQADAARIAHNKTSSTEYDSEAMADELKRLREDTSIDFDALNLSDKEMDFLTDDIGSFDDDALSLDLDTDIDTQETETQSKVEKTDASEVRVAEAFGFKTIPIAAVKTIRKLLSKAESDTGLTGREALIKWVDEL